MKLLFFYQHFWPDSPPYANLLRTLGAELVENDYEVEIITQQPSYKSSDRLKKCQSHEVLDGVQITRIPLIPGSERFRVFLLLGKVLFPIRAFLFILLSKLKGRPSDVIVAATMPPGVNGLFGLLAAKSTGAQFVYHLQDIYPEIGAAAGLWVQKSYRSRVLQWTESLICRLADSVVVLSDDMADALSSRGVDNQKVKVINNFHLTPYVVEDERRYDNRKQIIGASQNIKLVFAGNLGRFQGLELAVDAFLSLDSSIALELHILGDGILREILIDKCIESERVKFHGHMSFDNAKEIICQCDIGLVSLQPSIYKYCYPSKTLTYLDLNLPVFALIEKQSCLARQILEKNIGVVSDNTSVASIRHGYEKIHDYFDTSSSEREKNITDAKKYFTKSAVIPNWISLFENLCSVTESIKRRKLT